MVAYVTAEFTPKDKESLQAYSAKAAPIIAAYQGEFLIKAPIKELGAESDFEFKAIIAFPSQAQAEAWFNSTDYQQLISTRDQGMDSRFLLISNG